MFLRLLGAAAGGGYPQWNCACPLCQRARSAGRGAQARLHASLAASGSGKKWYLLNATPDVRLQIESFPALHPGPGLRETPLRGVLLTDAELDHTVGLLVLREGSPLEIFGTAAVLASLVSAFPVAEILRAYTEVRWREVRPGEELLLDEGRLRVLGFRAGGKHPRYTQRPGSGDWVVGYRLEDVKTRGVAVYAPSVERWSQDLAEAVTGADCVFLDGTFWTDDEMTRAGLGQQSASAMGHLAISGVEGSAKRLAALPAKRKVYVHINNTNPILDEDSPERQFLRAKGIEVGWDGMDLEV